MPRVGAVKKLQVAARVHPFLRIQLEGKVSSKRNLFVFVLLSLIVVVMLALPLIAGAQAAANGITAPKDGATVSGTVEVTGVANDPKFSKWQLDLLPNADANAPIFLALGTTPGDVKYALNTLPLPNGNHALRLRVVRADSNYDEYISKFTIANGAAKATTAVTPTVKATIAVTPTVKATVPVTPTVKATAPVTPTVKATAPVTPTVKATTPVTPTVKAAAPVTTTAKPAAAAPTANGLSAPKAGATVTGTVAVVGMANDPNFSKWQLDLLPNGNDNAPIFLALGTTPGELTYSLNTLPLPDGKHALRLRVVRNPDQNYNEYITEFVIANSPAKPAAAAPAAKP
jgi:hypothetical protein